MSIKLTLVRSAIGRPEKHRRVLKGLGPRAQNSQVTVANTPAYRGMIKKVLHLVTVEESNG